MLYFLELGQVNLLICNNNMGITKKISEPNDGGIPKILRLVRELIEHAKLGDALDALIEFLEKFSDDVLLNNATLLRSQWAYAQEQRSLSLVSNEEHNISFNRITKGVLETILGELEQPQEAALPILKPEMAYTKGKIMHNIAAKMVVNVRNRCTIRIAPEDIDVLENFEKTIDTQVQNIAIAKSMSVELMTIDDDVFKIASLSKLNQYRSEEHTSELQSPC